MGPSDFEFFTIFLPGSEKRLRLPPRFAKRFADSPPRTLSLYEADGGHEPFEIGLHTDNDGRLSLKRGWSDFVKAFGIEFGAFLVFCYREGDRLSAKIFDGTLTRRRFCSVGCDCSYHVDSDDQHTVHSESTQEDSNSMSDGSDDDYCL